jgi:uncharacterized protein
MVFKHLAISRSVVRLVCVTCLPLLLAAFSACSSSDTTAPDPGTPPVSPLAELPTCTATVSASAPLTDITTVQGASTTSALVSQTVTVRGVVVGGFQGSLPSTASATTAQLGGFFMQQAVPDADPLTSEGIFVFAPSATQVKSGDYVQAQGVVSEFGSAGSTITQLSGTVTVSICGSGVAVKPTMLTLPVAEAAALERYEGMLVEFTQTLAVTELFELGRFGQMALSLDGRQFHPNNGNVVVTNAQNLLARIVLDDGSTVQNPNPTPYFSAAGAAGVRRIGDTLQKLTGVLSHNFGAYRVHPVAVPVFVAANSRPATAPAITGSLKVASFNVLNYFTSVGPDSNSNRGANTPEEFTRQKAKIVEAIAGLDADVLGLMEIENNSDLATNDLLAALNAKLGAGTYAAVNSGKFGTDVIKVDILYKPAKVRRVGGVVLPTGDDLTNYTVASGRPPLAQRFAAQDNNGGFWFVVNHFKSKGSCNTTDPDLGQGCFNVARTTQANALNSFVTKLQAQGESDVLMMGDFNSYLLEDPTKVLEAAGHESLLKRMPANDRFTYVFGGETGALDHSYASGSLKTQVSGVGVWHINADEATVLDYNTEFKTDDRYAATPYRASDHDPVMVGLTLSPDAVVNLPLLSVNIPAAAQVSTPFGITVTEALPGGSATLTALTVDWGDSTAPSTLTAAGSASHTYAAAGTYTVLVTLSNSDAQSVTQTGLVTVSSLPPVVTAGQADLYFSEYIEGTGNNKALEIYNPTTATVDLSSYAVKLYANGTTTFSNVQSLTGTLSPGAVLVLVNNSATTAFKISGSITSSVANFNGDDAITLEKSGVVIDSIGQVGNRPVPAWTGGGLSTQDNTLRRKPLPGSAGDNNPADAFDPSVGWVAGPFDSPAGLGSHTP